MALVPTSAPHSAEDRQKRRRRRRQRFELRLPWQHGTDETVDSLFRGSLGLSQKLNDIYQSIVQIQLQSSVDTVDVFSGLHLTQAADLGETAPEEEEEELDANPLNEAAQQLCGDAERGGLHQIAWDAPELLEFEVGFPGGGEPLGLELAGGRRGSGTAVVATAGAAALIPTIAPGLVLTSVCGQDVDGRPHRETVARLERAVRSGLRVHVGFRSPQIPDVCWLPWRLNLRADSLALRALEFATSLMWWFRLDEAEGVLQALSLDAHPWVCVRYCEVEFLRVLVSRDDALVQSLARRCERAETALGAMDDCAGLRLARLARAELLAMHGAAHLLQRNWMRGGRCLHRSHALYMELWSGSGSGSAEEGAGAGAAEEKDDDDDEAELARAVRIGVTFGVGASLIGASLVPEGMQTIVQLVGVDPRRQAEGVRLVQSVLESGPDLLGMRYPYAALLLMNAVSFLERPVRAELSSQVLALATQSISRFPMSPLFLWTAAQKALWVREYETSLNLALLAIDRCGPDLAQRAFLLRNECAWLQFMHSQWAVAAQNYEFVAQSPSAPAELLLSVRVHLAACYAVLGPHRRARAEELLRKASKMDCDGSDQVLADRARRFVDDGCVQLLPFELLYVRWGAPQARMPETLDEFSLAMLDATGAELCDKEGVSYADSVEFITGRPCVPADAATDHPRLLCRVCRRFLPTPLVDAHAEAGCEPPDADAGPPRRELDALRLVGGSVLLLFFLRGLLLRKLGRQREAAKFFDHVALVETGGPAVGDATRAARQRRRKAALKFLLPLALFWLASCARADGDDAAALALLERAGKMKGYDYAEEYRPKIGRLRRMVLGLA